MRNFALLLLFPFVAGCGSLTDRIADTKRVELITIEKKCTVYVPRDFVNAQSKLLEEWAKQTQDCFQ